VQLRVLGGTAFAALALTGSAQAAGWGWPIEIANLVEQWGVPYGSNARRLLPIDAALCKGLRRYGVREIHYTDEIFHRFRCLADGADGHYYRVYIVVTNAQRMKYLKAVRVTGRIRGERRGKLGRPSSSGATSSP
jgi:hypothetical protein